MEWRHIHSPVKKKFPGSPVIKEGPADNVLGHKRTHNY